MDDIKVPRPGQRPLGSPVRRSFEGRTVFRDPALVSQATQERPPKTVKVRITFKKPSLPKLPFGPKVRRNFSFLKNARIRFTLVALAVLMLLAPCLTILQPYMVDHTYALGTADAVLDDKDALLTTKLKYDAKQQGFAFNADYVPSMGSDTQTSGGGPQIKAIASEDPAKGLSVSDPFNKVAFTIKPLFKLLAGKQDGNRVIYPMANGAGWLVYTMQAGGVKEDVVLRQADGNAMSLDYDLQLGDEFEARLEKDGSVGVYGSDLPIVGQVNTGSEKDAQLLQKARKKAPKNKLFFSIPAPVAYEAERAQSHVKVRYELKGSRLKTIATDLQKGHYPLSIDPTVTVTATTDLFRDTNPDSNVDFDVTTGNIARGKVTGGVLNSVSGVAWTTNANNLGTARFLHGATIYDDYAYVAGGAAANSASNLTTVEYARLSSVNSSIGTWATTTALPTALSRFQLVAYNGYMYAVGGASSTTNCGTVVNTVYYTRIQTNGQLSGTWSSASTLPTAVCGVGVSVYDGKIYAVGGRTGSTAATGVTVAAYATIRPNGSLSTWTSDDSVLPAARYDHDVRVYNGYIYVIGGNLNGTLANTVVYAPLAADGSIYGTGSGSWKSASTFGTARSNMGSTFTTTNDGYMYVQGGCGTFNGTFSCTAVRSETQVAQINADGTLGPWSDMATSLATLSRVGNAIVGWRGALYSLGGCTGMNTGTISCTTGAPTLSSQSYSIITTPGQVGPTNTTTALPTAIFAHGAIVNNGFLYVVGGCITNNCQGGAGDTTGQTSYAAIAADGTLGAWTTDTTHILNSAGIGGDTGLAAFGLTAYNNYLYVTGGYTDGGPTNNVYYVKLNTNGSLVGNWATGASQGTPISLGQTTYYNSAVAYHGFLFVFGGCIGTTGSAGCSTYRNINSRMVISPTTGQLSTLTSSAGTGNFLNLPTGKGLMAPALYNGYIYLAGGANSSDAQTNIVYYARIQDNGNITSWSTATGLMVHDLRRADAVAMNGYLYVFGGHNGDTNTTYGDIQIAKIDMSTGNLPSTFQNSVIQITPRWDERAVFANGYMYATGGCSVGAPPASCSTRSTVVEYIEVFNAGNKGTSAWSNASNVYTTNRTSASATTYNGYIYVAGGCTSYTVGTTFGNTDCVTGNANNTAAYAAINPDGSLGTWAAAPNLTASSSRVGGCLVAQAGYLYYVGGEDSGGAAITTVLYSQIGANGLPGAWSAATNGLPGARAGIDCAVFGDRIYVTGGEDAAGTDSTTVYYSPNLAAGGNIGSTWSTGTAFTTARVHHASVVAGGYLFVMGGDTSGTTALMDVQSIQLNPSAGGTTGSWQYSEDMPQGVSFQSAIAANGYIYLFGGRTAATACIANSYVASVNSTGRLSSWYQGINNFTTARFGTAAAFYNGYYYLLGGDNCTSIITTNVIQYGGQQSQAMKALLSKYADLAGNGTPWKFVTYLTNAVNNGVDIEKWRLKYYSSFESTNNWGLGSTIAPVISQTAYDVNSLDGSGTDVQLSRWFWFSLDINMEQSFSFTDDTQPTIFQYELHYSPPPAQRLMHGRDFRDQTQQGLDAHP